ncbi:hypothetical protein JCM3774_001799 [Rhodotorula dairenensis]
MLRGQSLRDDTAASVITATSLNSSTLTYSQPLRLLTNKPATLQRARDKLSRILSTAACEWTIVGLSLMDFFISLAQISYELLRDRTCECDRSCRPAPPLVDLLELWSLMITGVFVIEISLHIFASGVAYYTRARFGLLHLADSVIVIVSFGLELYLVDTEASVASLLIILRLWRLIKLFSSVEEGLETYTDLGLAEQEKEMWQKERAALRAEIARLRGQLKETRGITLQ